MPRSNRVQGFAPFNEPKRKGTNSSVTDLITTSPEPFPPPVAKPTTSDSSTSTLVNTPNIEGEQAQEEIPVLTNGDLKQESIKQAANGSIKNRRASIITGGPPSLFFSDGKRQIDYVLAYDDNGLDEDADDDDDDDPSSV